MPTQPIATQAAPASQRGEPTRGAPPGDAESRAHQNINRTSHAVGPSKARSANGVYVAAMNTKIIEWSSRRPTSGAPRSSTGRMVEGAGAEHRDERRGIHPRGKRRGAPSARTTRIVPAASAAKKAHSWKTPRRRGRGPEESTRAIVACRRAGLAQRPGDATRAAREGSQLSR